MKIFNLRAAVVALLGSLAMAQDLPALPNEMCDYDTVYEQIKTGNVVEVNLTVKHRNCPANRDNKPCRAENHQGFAPGPLLDGVQTDNSIVVNDEIPGPEIRAKLGDTIRVNVFNLLGEPTTMHFHGITQFRTPFMDGDEMISNCPIASGASHTYEFIAHPAGTTFYHSHSGSQRVAGMTGPLIIEDDEEPYADVDDKVVFIQDWYHQNADSNFEFWAQNTAPKCVTFGGNYFTGLLNPPGVNVGPVVGDGMSFTSAIVNGQGIYDYASTQINTTFAYDGVTGEQTWQEMQCPGQYNGNPPQCELCLNKETWTAELCDTSSGESLCGAPAVIEVTAGAQTRLRFINGGALFAFQVCIDAHAMDIVTADGAPVVPHPTDCFIIYSAERYDAIIAPTTPGDYWIRMRTTEQNSVNQNGDVDTIGDDYQNHAGYAILRVTDAASDVSYRSDTSPIACDDTITTNCGEKYWFASKTMGCASGPSRLDPDRCVTAFAALQPASSPNDDASLCGDLKMAHEVDANVKKTASLNFMADEVQRWQMVGLNVRIEILDEEEWGFPYIIPQDSAEWGTHSPVSFVNPGSPPLSLSPDQRAELYSKRTTFREQDPNNTDEFFPKYPVEFNKGVMGTQAIAVNYGDVVRIYFSCVAPFGPGCAMPHPMHLHGNKMAVLYAGEHNETYDESKFNPNPLYRDTVTVNTDQFVVVQVAATNPGAWRWHCHVNIHHRAAMAMLLDVGGNEAVEAVRATPADANLCPIQPSTTSASDSGSSTDGGSTDGGSTDSGSTDGDAAVEEEPEVPPSAGTLLVSSLTTFAASLAIAIVLV